MKKMFVAAVVVILTVPFIYCQKIKILTNQLGYNPDGVKTAVVEAYKDDKISNAQIIVYSNDKKVADFKPVKVGKIDQWKNWYFWTIDFSSVHDEGTYYIKCETNKGIISSFPFDIQKNILERHTISDVLAFFKELRSVGQFEKADRTMTFSDGRNDTVDAHGGWQDATGDYGKHLSGSQYTNYFDPEQIPLVVYSLCKTYNMLNKRDNKNFTQYKRRIIDELLYGADYLVRIKDPTGSFYNSVSAPGLGKKPEDRRFSPAMNGFSITTLKPDTSNENARRRIALQKNMYEASFRSGGGISIADLAMASRFDVCGDFSSATYLKCAEDAFDYLEKNSPAVDYDGKNNILDDYCALAASVELYKATKKDIYKNAADKRAESLLGRLTSWKKYSNYWRADDKDRPFFHASDEGFPVVSLIYYLDICDNAMKEKVLNVIKKSLQFDLAITSEVPNAFGYAREFVQHKDGSRNTSFFYPHDTETEPWWQGEDARLASLATAARLAIPYFKSDKNFTYSLEKYADDQLNWILGLNPFDVCMLYGIGRNNPEYRFFGSYQYTNVPGGISNGITSGLNNPHDIDFDIPYSVTGKDYDWRWTEQWLPHDSWYLMAVSAGEED